jgi:hypothetical protein
MENECGKLGFRASCTEYEDLLVCFLTVNPLVRSAGRAKTALKFHKLIHESPAFLSCRFTSSTTVFAESSHSQRHFAVFHCYLQTSQPLDILFVQFFCFDFDVLISHLSQNCEKVRSIIVPDRRFLLVM